MQLNKLIVLIMQLLSSAPKLECVKLREVTPPPIMMDLKPLQVVEWILLL